MRSWQSKDSLRIGLVFPVAVVGGIACLISMTALIGLSYTIGLYLSPGSDSLNFGSIIGSLFLSAAAALVLVPISAIIGSGVSFILMKLLKIPNALTIASFSCLPIMAGMLVVILNNISVSPVLAVILFSTTFQLVAVILAFKNKPKLAVYKAGR